MHTHRLFPGLKTSLNQPETAKKPAKQSISLALQGFFPQLRFWPALVNPRARNFIFPKHISPLYAVDAPFERHVTATAYLTAPPRNIRKSYVPFAAICALSLAICSGLACNVRIISHDAFARATVRSVAKLVRIRGSLTKPRISRSACKNSCVL